MVHGPCDDGCVPRGGHVHLGVPLPNLLIVTSLFHGYTYVPLKGRVLHCMAYSRRFFNVNLHWGILLHRFLPRGAYLRRMAKCLTLITFWWKLFIFNIYPTRSSYLFPIRRSHHNYMLRQDSIKIYHYTNQYKVNASICLSNGVLVRQFSHRTRDYTQPLLRAILYWQVL